MNSLRALVLSSTLGLPLASCSNVPAPAVDRAESLRSETLPPAYARLRAAANAKPPPAPGDWLSIHKESGQSLAEFGRMPHRVPTTERGTIVLTRLGNVTPEQNRVLALTAMYVETFFGRPVRFAPDLDLARIPASAQRESRGFGLQVRTSFVLDSLMTPERPPDAFVYVAFSTLDLFPEASWNFVFGQARPAEGVGVWSLARFSEAPGADRGDRLLLRRTMRTASHEVGHLLGLPHCIAYECLMNGSNSLEESDARPLELCPVCMAKLCASLGLDSAARMARLANVLDEFGMAREAARERKMQRLVEGKAE
jgi:archaemetzincin